MAFQDDLRRYLEQVQVPRAPSSHFNPDLRVHRRHLLEGLRQLEEQGAAKHVLSSIHREWSARVDSFAARMGTALVNGLAHQAPPEEVTDLINVALRRELQLDASTGSFVIDSELDRLASRTRSSADEPVTAQYALEIRATRRAGEGREVTPLGRIALELPEKDILRWLLTAEALQSRGPDDEWRLSRSGAQALCARPHDTVTRMDEDDRPPVCWPTMRRLYRMGILGLEEVEDDQVQDYFYDRYEVAEGGLPILQDIASGKDTPFAVLIAALLSDETNVALASLLPDPQLGAQPAVVATTRHARMVAHEIRNALVPVQGALDGLYRAAVRQGSEQLIEEHRDPIDHGIERVFQFIHDMMEAADRGAEPPAAFSVVPAVRDAIAATSSELGLGVDFDSVRDVPPVTGHRHRFVLAVVNLLRNAAQAVLQPTGRVRVRVEADGDYVTILVDDDGPGVPQEHRSTIFEVGVKLRAEGTGQGLALVREVVESEMGGQAGCEESSLGGARFVLKLPVTGKTTP